MSSVESVSPTNLSQIRDRKSKSPKSPKSKRSRQTRPKSRGEITTKTDTEKLQRIPTSNGEEEPGQETKENDHDRSPKPKHRPKSKSFSLIGSSRDRDALSMYDRELGTPSLRIISKTNSSSSSKSKPPKTRPRRRSISISNSKSTSTRMNSGRGRNMLSLRGRCHSEGVRHKSLPQKKLLFGCGDKYILMDAGGGTVDIACHQVIGDRNSFGLKRYYHHVVDSEVKIDNKFIDLLNIIFSKEWVNQFKEISPTGYIKLMENFRFSKNTCFVDSVYFKSHNIELPLEFIEYIKEECKKDGIPDLEEKVKKTFKTSNKKLS